MNPFKEPLPRTASPYTDPNVQGPRAQILASGIQADLRKSTSCQHTKLVTHLVFYIPLTHVSSQ